ncbi:MAG TPA: YceI family protein [Terriglobales bacterium]|jgi:polyisoprenoid-binding protein YceI
MKKARVAVCGVFFCTATLAVAQMHDVVLEFQPAKTVVNYTLGASLHTVHGTFQLKRGRIQYSLGNGSISGEIVIDATTGQSGNDGRDHKMHEEIIESGKYSEITFRPDRVEGRLVAEKSSTLQVHGMFSVHGAEHEVTLPIQVQISSSQWSVDTNFQIPYLKWGMKNPSKFLLRVEPEVAIAIHATGAVNGPVHP